jgi:hypothetical protein
MANEDDGPGGTNGFIIQSTKLPQISILGRQYHGRRGIKSTEVILIYLSLSGSGTQDSSTLVHNERYLTGFAVAWWWYAHLWARGLMNCSKERVEMVVGVWPAEVPS